MVSPSRRKSGSRKDRAYYVYIMASKRNGTLYVGFTNDLIRRIYAHQNDLAEGFTKKYGVHTLVYYEQGEDFDGVLQREKQLKEWRREWKLALIEEKNPEWKDLYPEILGALDSDFHRNGKDRTSR